MKNQEFPIILGVILILLVYVLFIRRSEGMVAAAKAAIAPPASSCQTSALISKGGGKYELYKRVRPLKKCGTVVGGYTALKMADIEKRSNIMWEGRPGAAPEGHPAKKVFKISTTGGSNSIKREMSQAFIYFFMNKLTNINRVYVRSRREIVIFAVPPNSKTKPMPSNSRYSFAAYKMTPVGAGVLVAAAPTTAAAKAALVAAAAAKLTPAQWAAGDKNAPPAPGAPAVAGAPPAPGAPAVGPQLLAPPPVPGAAPPAAAALIATPAAAAAVRAAQPPGVAPAAAPPALRAAPGTPAAVRAAPGDPASSAASGGPPSALLHSTHKPPKPSAAASPSAVTPVAAAPWVASATAAGWHKHPL